MSTFNITATDNGSLPPIAPWAWVTDGVLWALLLLLMVWGLPTLFQRGTPRQQLSFQLLDANALIPGTNVYWMGVNVGAVDNVVLTPHAAEVSIDMHRNLPPIPWGTHVSVAFTGLGGNKEVQLLPPEVMMTFDQPRKVVVEPSQRLKQVLQVNTEIALYLKQGADGLSNLLGQAAPQQDVAFLRQNIFKLNTMTGQTRYWINDMAPSFLTMQQAVHHKTEQAQSNMSLLSHEVQRLETTKARFDGAHPLQATLNRLTEAETQLIKASDFANDARTSLQALQHGVAVTKAIAQPALSDLNPTPIPHVQSNDTFNGRP